MRFQETTRCKHVCIFSCYLLLPGCCAGSSERWHSCVRRWRRGCWGPSLTVPAWAGLGAWLPAVVVERVVGAGCGGDGRGWRGCRSRKGTLPGPCTRAGRCLHRRAGSCPRVWDRGRLTGGRCAPPPGSSPSPAPCWKLHRTTEGMNQSAQPKKTVLCNRLILGLHDGSLWTAGDKRKRSETAGKLRRRYWHHAIFAPNRKK